MMYILEGPKCKMSLVFDQNTVFQKTPFSEFLKNIDDGRVVQLEIKGNDIEGIL